MNPETIYYGIEIIGDGTHWHLEIDGACLKRKTLLQVLQLINERNRRLKEFAEADLKHERDKMI